MWDSFPTILPSNKIYHRASLETYVAFKQPLLNRDSTRLLSLESSNKVHHRASPETYVALKQPLINRDSTRLLYLESSNKVNPLFDI